MASEFSELCEMYQLSPGDPEAIDKLIYLINETNENLDEGNISEDGLEDAYSFGPTIH